jgi:hypothetical protein
MSKFNLHFKIISIFNKLPEKAKPLVLIGACATAGLILGFLYYLASPKTYISTAKINIYSIESLEENPQKFSEKLSYESNKLIILSMIENFQDLTDLDKSVLSNSIRDAKINNSAMTITLEVIANDPNLAKSSLLKLCDAYNRYFKLKSRNRITFLKNSIEYKTSLINLIDSDIKKYSSKNIKGPEDLLAFIKINDQIQDYKMKMFIEKYELDKLSETFIPITPSLVATPFKPNKYIILLLSLSGGAILGLIISKSLEKSYKLPKESIDNNA